jgi:hypothetical protein
MKNFAIISAPGWERFLFLLIKEAKKVVYGWKHGSKV